MATRATRRYFLHTAAATTAMASLGDLGFLARLRPVSAEEANLDPMTVRFGSAIEPLVRMLEDTPRDRLLEEVGARLHKGLSYRDLLAALLLAGVRNVQPRPSVGHKFHSVLVVNSAHLASMSSPDEHRWLPIFWALDYFKSSQAQDVRENNWTMPAVDESSLPTARRARAAFVEAMEGWDEGATDAATAALARTAGANEIYELLYRYGARDYRSIGHKAIYVANSSRTLGCIGWQHAEPVLRSLTYALLNHEGSNPTKGDAEADRPYRRNLELLGKIREDWQDGKPDDSATREMLSVLREGSNDEACDKAIELVNRGVSPQSIWDALYVGAGELLIRQPGIVALHAMTTTNAIGYAYRATGNDETRRLLMLQNAAFLPMFRNSMGGRGKVKEFDITQLGGTQQSAESNSASLEEIFTNVSGDRSAAAEGVMGYLAGGGDAKELIDAARLLTFLKGNNAHDYKFSSAALEDYYHVSPAWRDRYLASSVFNLRGSNDSDNSLVQRTRAALQA